MLRYTKPSCNTQQSCASIPLVTRSETASAGVQSVERALVILDILARSGEAGVTSLANEIGVHKSTALRLVSTLEQGGLVEQTGDRGKYRLGVGVLRLAGATAARLDVVAEARPICRRLAADTGETINIAVLSDARRALRRPGRGLLDPAAAQLGRASASRCTRRPTARCCWAGPRRASSPTACASSAGTPRTPSPPPTRCAAELDEVRRRAGPRPSTSSRSGSPRWPRRSATRTATSSRRSASPGRPSGSATTAWPRSCRSCCSAADEISHRLGWG